MQRFTPRKPGSNWITVKSRRWRRRRRPAVTRPAGLAAFERRADDKSGVYTFEPDAELVPEYYAQLRSNKAGTYYCESRLPGHRRTGIHQEMSGKREETVCGGWRSRSRSRRRAGTSSSSVDERSLHHHVLDLGRGGQPRAVPGDPLHARGVRRRGEAGGGRGLLDDPHPRAHARRRAELRGGGLPRDHRGDPRRGRRRDHQLLHRRDRHPDREADRVPARAEAGRGRAQHGLDELREVLAQAQGLRVQDRLRELVRHDHRVRRRR